MSDSGGKGTFDVRAFLGSLSEGPLADGLPVVVVRSQQEQRAFVCRALDALQVVPDIAENRVPLFSSATQAITNIGEEARDQGYGALAEVLVELMWSLLEVHADRAEYEGEWGPMFEGHAANTPRIEVDIGVVQGKWDPKQSSPAWRGVHASLSQANRLLLEIYLTGRARACTKTPG